MQENHPVWDVYDQLRTAHLNECITAAAPEFLV
jgi:hypothetical protein